MLRVAEEFHKSDTGRQRRGNEDALYARAPLFVVADGMGGAQAGEVASKMAVDTVGRGLPDGGAEPPQELLAGLVEEANEQIHSLSREDADRAGMGTTITAMYVGADEAAIAHVGDSRAYRLRGGRLERLTDDHSLVEEFLRQGKLTPEEARDHPQKSIITRALGPEPDVEVDRQTVPLRDGDVFLLCSDGLTSMVEEDHVERLLAGAGSLQDAGTALVRAANDAGGRDNITVVLFRVEDVDGAAASPPTRQHETETAQGQPSAPRTDEVRAAVATAERDAARAEAERRRPRPRVAAEAPKRRRRLPGWVKGAVVALLVLVPVVIGLWVASQAVYFVGTDDQARVAVFRGLPYDLPLGLDLYSTNYVSGVTVPEVAAVRREALLDHTLRSRDDAYDLVRQLERGELQ